MLYIFVTGGVVSSVGKGIAAASIGRVIKSAGYNITLLKLDPYLNLDPGTLSPLQHGEVFVTKDGAETDLDLGHYERLSGVSMSHANNVTMGGIYKSILKKERAGYYKGKTVQVIPHVTNEIKDRITRLATPDMDFVIVEVGGTVGDIESLPFFEAIREMILETNCIVVHIGLLPYIQCANEIKTKPLQHSVRALQALGITPNYLLCRVNNKVAINKKDVISKLSKFCNVKSDSIYLAPDVSSVYQIPNNFKSLGEKILTSQQLPTNNLSLNLSQWSQITNPSPSVSKKVVICGKYTQLPDSYLSIKEALDHTGYDVEITYIDSEEFEDDRFNNLPPVDALIIPGGFGARGIQGMVKAAKLARINNLPTLGICLGLQVMVIEWARNIAGLDANSFEFDKSTSNPVIDLMPEQKDLELLGGTLRLGYYPSSIEINSLLYQCYKKELIYERHRHRYEVNQHYLPLLNRDGFFASGLSPNKRYVEAIEFLHHRFYIGVQYHPEFESSYENPHPLFIGLLNNDYYCQ